MIEFLKNLFKIGRKKKSVETDEEGFEHHIYEDDIDIFINRGEGIIRLEAPAERELSQSEIVEICRKFLRDDF